MSLRLRTCANISCIWSHAACRPQPSPRSSVPFGFFYGTTLGRAGAAEHIPLARKGRYATGCAHAGSGGATPQSRARLGDADAVHRHLFGGTSYLRGCCPGGARYRQRQHGHSRSARQRPQGPLRDAVGAAPCDLTLLLAGRPPKAPAIPWTRSKAADHRADAAAGLSRGGPHRRPRSIGYGAYAAT